MYVSYHSTEQSLEHICQRPSWPECIGCGRFSRLYGSGLGIVYPQNSEMSRMLCRQTFHQDMNPQSDRHEKHINTLKLYIYYNGLFFSVGSHMLIQFESSHYPENIIGTKEKS